MTDNRLSDTAAGAPDFNDPETLRQLRQRQRGRAVATAVLLIVLCALFYGITIVKIGMS